MSIDPKPDKDDTPLFLFALLGAFAAGGGAVLVLALAARVDSLRRELDARPAVVVVERMVGHD